MSVKVEFSTRKYEITHGRTPRGFGTWFFTFEGQTFTHMGTFAEARKACKAAVVETVRLIDEARTVEGLADDLMGAAAESLRYAIEFEKTTATAALIDRTPSKTSVAHYALINRKAAERALDAARQAVEVAADAAADLSKGMNTARVTVEVGA